MQIVLSKTRFEAKTFGCKDSLSDEIKSYCIEFDDYYYKMMCTMHKEIEVEDIF
jgi:hypothetical protein